MALHRRRRPPALAEVVLSAQRSGSVAELLRGVGEGLACLGLEAAVLRIEGSHFSLWRGQAKPVVDALVARLTGAPSGSARYPLPGVLRRAVEHDEPQLFKGLVARLRLWTALAPAARQEAALALAALGLDALVLVPLRVDERPWGALLVGRESLRATGRGALGALQAFAGQLSGSIALLERLEGLSAETALAQQLANVGPEGDAQGLSELALATVCLATRSDAGTLHRYSSRSGTFELVGTPHGEPGPALEAYRSFKAPAGAFKRTRTLPLATLTDADQALRDSGFRHLAITALSIDERPVGLLTLARRDDSPYTDRELHSAVVLGLQLASLLERTGLYAESKRLYADLKQSYDDLGRTQAELVRHERLAALGELAAVMAHEVRNPLGVIFNSLSTLRRLVRPSEDVDLLLNMVGEEADRLDRIVNDLLDFARPFELSRRAVPVAPIIASAIEAATRALPANCSVAMEVAPALSPFAVDAHLLRQALVNLVLNALQAMPRGGRVLVRVSSDTCADSRWLVIDVVDEGAGLHPKAAEKLFQPFWTTKATGTGLGLAVVKRIVDAHYGQVTARSNEGLGTTFTLRIPDIESPAQEAAPAAEA
jgi:two-component system sensor histidine kinase HydH